MDRLLRGCRVQLLLDPPAAACSAISCFLDLGLLSEPGGYCLRLLSEQL